MRALLGRTACIVRIRPFGHLVVDTGHLNLDYKDWKQYAIQNVPLEQIGGR
jgi:hypothetical protein